ncbi:MAG: bifunctional demethylmenaquinone methyltransferase/2-methoxy-6-polyprenyl-1,4-benzoquinol methylase UbiE [Candidatus Kapaibacterium sp.]
MAETQFNFTSGEEKKAYVRNMFSNIAQRYDFLNHFLSFGLDYRWRGKAVGIVKKHLQGIQAPRILDIACGTGDLAFELLNRIPDAKITGIDLAKPMLEIFQQKIDERKVSIAIAEGDVEALLFADHSFDAVTIGFGTRNFTRLDIAFKEIARVLKPGGIFVNLELSKPRSFPMKQLYGFYSKAIMPAVGKLFSRNSEAYTYLPDSIQRFPEREEIMKMLRDAGFASSEWKDLTQGIVSMHISRK